MQHFYVRTLALSCGCYSTQGGTQDPGSEGGTTDVTAPQGGTNNPGSEGGTDINTGNLPATPGAGEDGAGSAGGMDTENGNSSAGGADMGNGMFDRMSSAAVKLQYLGDDFGSYSDILDNAKTDVTDGDKTRLIESLKILSSGENIENVVNVEEVIRYFVVNNFLVNGDSYVGSMVHNYYLYEEDGKLSMIPWDYNLAYGTFHTLQTNSSVNDPIDTPLSVTGDGDRPMMDWIINDEDYLARYHQYFAQFLAENDVMAMLEQTLTLITPYVEKDPTRFYTISEFETGVETLRRFLTLRIQSVEGQLAGTIPATSDGQRLNSSALIATGNLVLSDMGAMNMGGMGGFGGNQGNPGEDPSSAGGAQGTTAPNLPEGWSCSFLFATLAGDYLADIPQMGNGTFGLRLLLVIAVFHIDGVGAAVTALHLDVPTALVHDHSRTPADGAFFQQNQFIHSQFLLI